MTKIVLLPFLNRPHARRLCGFLTGERHPFHDCAPRPVIATEIASPETALLDIIRREVRLAAKLGKDSSLMPFQMQGVGLIRAAVGLGQFRLALFPPVLPLDYLRTRSREIW